MKITIYGLTITSSWGNGHATTFRSLCKALHRRGHQIDFVEEDVEWYRNNRDMPNPSFCKVHLFRDWLLEVPDLLSVSSGADVIVIGSYFPHAIDLTYRLKERAQQPIFFYDIDTPITLAQLRATGHTQYLQDRLIPEYSAYLSFTGGPLLQELEDCFGAKRADAFYCSVDPELYKPTQAMAHFCADLSYLGTYAPDRQKSLNSFLKDPALLRPEMRFIVAGPQYPDTISWGPNIQHLIHLSPSQHAAFYSSARFTLNLTRSEMIAAGWSPSVRLFEASACGATIFSDQWNGLDQFFTEGEEILLPTSSLEIAELLNDLSDTDRRNIGSRARQRVLDEHTSIHRAVQFEKILSECTT